MMSQLIDRIQEGGPVFMIPLVLIIITIVVLFILSLLGKKSVIHTNQLIGHLSLFAMIVMAESLSAGLLKQVSKQAII